ncbi:MAG TPA: YIP1 family protein [Pantanalinema sp.]
MLESVYQTIFRPRSPLLPLSGAGAWALFLIISVFEALGIAGDVGARGTGAVFLTLGLFAINVLGWFWLSSAASLLAELMGGEGSGERTMRTLAAALAPAILSAPLHAIAPRFDRLSALLSFALALWVVVNLVRAIAQAHGFGRSRAALCLVGATGMAALGLGALVGMPIVAIALLIGP